MLDQLRFRASGIAPLFTGTDGLTEAQAVKYAELSERAIASVTDPKKKLTDNMRVEYERLHVIKTNFDNGIVELPTGAKTYVEELVNQIVYKYRPSFGDRKTEKGNRVEDDGIELINQYFMADYKKSLSHLEVDFVTGHPDIEDEENRMIADLKCSWNKQTFPKLPEQISNSTYEWQIKTYLWLKSCKTQNYWMNGRLIYVLMSTPEDLVPDFEGDDLHYVDDLDIRMRVTYVDFKITHDDIDHMERRLSAAVKYAEEYYNKLMQKCSN